jgi:hypothetical protein
MKKLEKPVAVEPPAPRAPLVLSCLRSVRGELADLKMQIAERALACAEGKPGARQSLADLRRRISDAEFLIAGSGPARELAARLDEAATVAWKSTVQTLEPDEIVAGVTRDSCCHRCLIGAGCVITGSDHLAGPCAHPVLVGALEKDRYWDNPKIMAVYAAACAVLGIGRRAA